LLRRDTNHRNCITLVIGHVGQIVFLVNRDERRRTPHGNRASHLGVSLGAENRDRVTRGRPTDIVVRNVKIFSVWRHCRDGRDLTRQKCLNDFVTLDNRDGCYAEVVTPIYGSLLGELQKMDGRRGRSEPK
jgi:hypothetical protein